MTWSPLSGDLSLNCRTDLSGAVGILHAVRGPIWQPPIESHGWQSGHTWTDVLPQVRPLHELLSVQALPSSQLLPSVLNVQLAVQHEDGEPLSGPSSQSSAYDGPASSVPLPHRLSIVRVTK